ncbi:MAG: BON domain-containing protein [Acidobacteria bacterium]|nr:BON domain-containing protein [Acidobacteriota bacterium]
MRKLIPSMAAVIAVSFIFVLSACDRPAGERSQTGMGTTDIEQAIRDRFNSDPQLSGTDIDVSTDLQKREIRLSGTAGSQEIRDKAVQMAQSAAPGFSVSDSIEVEPREMARTEEQQQEGKQEREAAKNRGDNVGDSPEDARIYSQVVGRLSTSDLPFQSINLDVQDGVVTLRGNVRDENQKNQAQTAVQQVEGVMQVNNELEAGGQQQSTPAQ